jgi:hypothetical protein
VDELPKGGNFWDNLAPTWVYAISLLAGLVGFLEELQPTETIGQKILKGCSRVASSALAAVLTYQFCVAIGVSDSWLIPITGVGAHMGTSALKLLASIYRDKLGIK